jgi:molybdenum cofactor biosynthesis enzyme MoaA
MTASPLKPYVTISLTDACNMRCVYCPPAGENYQTPHAVFELKKLDGVLRTIADLEVSKIRFTGGEPLLYPHLRAAMLYASHLGLEIHVNTNGLLLEKHIDWLPQIPNLFIKVSLDAHTDRAMRRVNGVAAAEKVLRGLRLGAEKGLVQRINLVLTQLNFDQIPGIHALCKELGIGMKIFDMFPVPETEKIWQALYAPPDALSLKGTPAPPYAYTQKYGTPTREKMVDGVHVRIKNCFDGTHYHQVCKDCKAFPCPEGLYCLLVTPSLTVVPCRLGMQLHRPCQNFSELFQYLHEGMVMYADSFYLNCYGEQHGAFYAQRLAERQNQDCHNAESHRLGRQIEVSAPPWSPQRKRTQITPRAMFPGLFSRESIF